MNIPETAGYSGEGVRSDCLVRLTPTPHKPLSVFVKSKVKALYGDSIESLAREMLRFYSVAHALLEIDDQGALPFVLAARMEAVMRNYSKSDREFLLPVDSDNWYETQAGQLRVTRLYLPGNQPKLMINAGIHGSNGIILDLEDAVPPDRKYEARFLVRNALRSVNFYGAERMVRINPLPEGRMDLAYVVNQPVNLILIPKCEQASQVVEVCRIIAELQQPPGRTIHVMPIIESAAGVLNAYSIATSARQVVALAIGLEDYTADMGVQRTPEGRETDYARSMIVHAAAAAGIQAIDSVFSSVDDPEGLYRYAKSSKDMGFKGMGCIHPGQIQIIRNGFLPGEAELSKARRIAEAYDIARQQGLSVVCVDGKMVDPPVVKRALQTLESAKMNGPANHNRKKDL